MGADPPALFPLSRPLSPDTAFTLTHVMICSNTSVTRQIFFLFLYPHWTALRSFLHESYLCPWSIYIIWTCLSHMHIDIFKRELFMACFPLQISVKNWQLAKGLLKSVPETMSLKSCMTSSLAIITPLLGMDNACSLWVFSKLSLILSQNALLWILRQWRQLSYHRLRSVKLKWFLKVIKPSPFIL